MTAQTEVIISMVPDSPDVEQVALGDDGIIAAATAGQIYIDMSTIAPQTAIEVAEKLDVSIAIETHHSYSSNYVYMQNFEKEFKSKNIGWIFDIGNYENDNMRWKALEEIKKNR